MKGLLSAAGIGILFGLGIGLGGMADPAKVVGFLDVTGAWDPSLALVMAGALAVHIPLRRLILRGRRPLLAPAFPATPPDKVDRRLVLGSALFGVGWGLSGYCPGPAVVNVATGVPLALLFVGAMLGGMGLFRAWERWEAARAAPAASLGAADPG